MNSFSHQIHQRPNYLSCYQHSFYSSIFLLYSNNIWSFFYFSKEVLGETSVIELIRITLKRRSINTSNDTEMKDRKKHLFFQSVCNWRTRLSWDMLCCEGRKFTRKFYKKEVKSWWWEEIMTTPDPSFHARIEPFPQ